MTGQRAAWGMAAAAVAVQVPYPLLDGELRDRLTVVAVVVFFLATVTTAAASRGPAWAAAYAALVVTLGLAVEAVGLRTGRPFGSYAYGDRLGPAVLGVPAVVPLAWAMMAYPCRVAAARLVTGRARRTAVGAAALAGWDAFLDPQMVAAGHWRWRASGRHLPGVPDVPLTNYGGWAVVSLAVMGALEALPDRSAVAGDGPAALLFGWTYVGSVLANAVFLRRPWVALWGGLGMGTVALPWLRSLARG